MKLLGRGVFAIVSCAVALGIDVLMSVVASRAWSWRASAGIVLGAAVIGAAVDAAREHVRSKRPKEPTKPAPWPGDDMLVERPAEKSQIIRALRSRRRGTHVVIVEGEGGYGKSTLARSVYTDPAVSKRYSSIYPVDCGAEADSPLKIARVVNGLLADITGHRPEHVDPISAGQHLGRALAEKGKVLLVVDNVWTADQLWPFLVGARRCTRLVTTRAPSLPPDGATWVPIGPMSPEQSRNLLTRGLPPAMAADLIGTDVLGQVLSRTWHCPLILSQLSEVLQKRVSVGYSPEAALGEILEHLAARGPAGTDELSVRSGKPPSELVEGSLNAGVALLRKPPVPHSRERLVDLAVFPPHALVPARLIAKLWASRSSHSEAEAASWCSRMAELRFFTITDGHLQLHDVMREYLRKQLSETVRAMLAGLVVDLMSQDLAISADGADQGGSAISWWQEGAFADYIRENALLHMMQAGRQDEADSLVCDLRWALYRLQADGATAVLADLAAVGTDRALELSGIVGRVTHMLSRPDADQYLLNVLRQERGWVQQAITLQAGQHEPTLVSRWTLPDNPGPALRHAYKVPFGPSGLFGPPHGDAVALSPDGTWLAMAGDGGIFIVDAATRLIRALFPSDQRVSKIAITRDGHQLAILHGGAGTITVHDMANGSVISRCRDDGILWSVAFTPDGASLVTTGNDGHVKGWDAQTGERLRRYDGNYFPRYSQEDPPGRGSNRRHRQ